MPFSINPDLIENNDVEIQTVDGELALFHKPSGNTLIVDEDTTVSEKLQSPLRDDVDLDGNDLISGGSGEFTALEADSAIIGDGISELQWKKIASTTSLDDGKYRASWSSDFDEYRIFLEVTNDGQAGEPVEVTFNESSSGYSYRDDQGNLTTGASSLVLLPQGDSNNYEYSAILDINSVFTEFSQETGISIRPMAGQQTAVTDFALNGTFNDNSVSSIEVGSTLRSSGTVNVYGRNR